MVELLIVTVLGTLVLAAILQSLITSQRVFTAQNEQIRGTQSIRAAMAVMSSELREISPPQGDLVVMTADSLEIRAQRKLGVICDDPTLPLGTVIWNAIIVGDTIDAGDSVFVFADNNSLKQWDDVWILTTVAASVGAGTVCAGNDTQLLTFNDPGGAFAADSVSTGAEVRTFEHVKYGLMQRTGQWFLGRRLSSGGWQPIVGPVRANDGLQFAYYDETGSVTATASEVALIEVTVQTGGDVLGPAGEMVEDSVTVRIHTRN